MTIELPPGVRVEHTLAAVGPHGLTLVIGQQNPRLSAVGPDRIDIENKINWLMSMHLSPPAMKALALQIDETVAIYEQTNGPIQVQTAPPQKPKLSVVSSERPPVEQPPPVPSFWPAASVPGVPEARHPLSDEAPQPEPEPSPSGPSPSPVA